MGLQYTLVVVDKDLTRHYFNGDFPREHYGLLPIITGRQSEMVARDCWSGLIDPHAVQWFTRLVGVEGIIDGNGGMLSRLTIT